MKEKILEILKNTLPEKTNIIVSDLKGVFDGEPQLMIGFSVSDKLINNVGGQYLQLVSLWLKLDSMELTTQCFGGSGGNKIYIVPDLNNPNEKYLAMVGVKVPFKRPLPNETAVLGAIERFAKNWVKTLRENKERLRYSEFVDYEEFLRE